MSGAGGSSGPGEPGGGRGDEAGVFANLPRNRPSVRSPRRERATAAAKTEQAPGGEPDRGPARGREAEVEALARAGVSLAGEAATLGLRVAGRAAAALRNAVERR